MFYTGDYEYFRYIYIRRASEQILNEAKLFIIFGNQVDNSLKQDIKNVLDLLTKGGMGILYLGLPKQNCGSKMTVFSFVQDQLNERA